ncbi:hypothetical protein B0H19DRAFT_1227879 [Mycena capillaripes]|nr:hypothetical protein B0H19DRAFT_1227879 [Mycena capillaripes]
MTGVEYPKPLLSDMRTDVQLVSFRYTALGCAIAFILAYNLYLNRTTRLHQLEEAIRQTEEIFEPAKTQWACPETAQEWVRLLEVKRSVSEMQCRILEPGRLTWKQYLHFKRCLAECTSRVNNIRNAIQLIRETERQRNLAKEIIETNSVLANARFTCAACNAVPRNQFNIPNQYGRVYRLKTLDFFVSIWTVALFGEIRRFGGFTAVIPIHHKSSPSQRACPREGRLSERHGCSAGREKRNEEDKTRGRERTCVAASYERCGYKFQGALQQWRQSMDEVFAGEAEERRGDVDVRMWRRAAVVVVVFRFERIPRCVRRSGGGVRCAWDESVERGR